MTWILLIGLQLLFIHVKPPVMQVWLTKKNSHGFNFLSHLVPCQILCTSRLGDIAVQVLILNQELRKSER